MSLFESMFDMDKYANYIDRVYEEAKARNHGERSRDLKEENKQLKRNLKRELKESKK
jgi:hypothetical protein